MNTPTCMKVKLWTACAQWAMCSTAHSKGLLQFLESSRSPSFRALFKLYHCLNSYTLNAVRPIFVSFVQELSYCTLYSRGGVRVRERAYSSIIWSNWGVRCCLARRNFSMGYQRDREIREIEVVDVIERSCRWRVAHIQLYRRYKTHTKRQGQWKRPYQSNAQRASLNQKKHLRMSLSGMLRFVDHF